MSKYNQGYLGAQIGKLGNAVGRMWKGRPVMAVYQPNVHNPRTEAQQIVRARFAVLAQLSSAFLSGIREGMGFEAKRYRLTEGNVFIRRNYSQVTAASPDDVSINYSGLSVSDGNCPEASFGQVDFGTGQHLQISAPLTGGGDQPGADDNDSVYLFAYCPEMKQGVLGSAAKRSAASVAVNVPARWDGMDVHVYGFVVSCNRQHPTTSATTYCGSGEVA